MISTVFTAFTALLLAAWLELLGLIMIAAAACGFSQRMRFFLAIFNLRSVTRPR